MTTQPNDGQQYLDDYPHLRRFIQQCAACQQQGYAPTKLAEAEIHYNARQNIERYFPAMELNERGLCEPCATALGNIDHDTNT